MEQFAASGQRGRLTEQLSEIRKADGHGIPRGFEWYYWWHRCRDDTLLVLRGHSRDVEGLAFFPDGRRFATCAGRLIRIWDLTTGGMLQELHSPEPILSAVAISPDGKWLASTSLHREKIFVWDLSSGRLTHSRVVGFGPTTELHFADDGNTLICTDWVGLGKIWDLKRGGETRTVEIHTRVFAPEVAQYAWSRSGRIVATAGVGNLIRVVDLERNVVSASNPRPGGKKHWPEIHA